MSRFSVAISLCAFLLFTLSADKSKATKLAEAARKLTLQHVTYEPAYFTIKYPGGDVPSNKGVCTDVVIRAYRAVGIDLQKEVHEDMSAHFSEYPKKWGLRSTDRNIDHRRVPNLMVFFSRNGAALPVTIKAADYLPGDVVAWDLGNGLTHIGIVSKLLSQDGKRLLIVHNIGAGQMLEDCLFRFRIIGHYRYRVNG
ncbi:MAG: DUF1287 domain-containing protein [Sphingobacteriales bacterium]|nr:MAG: DUF1287 domain-containing protein [Sphingobacteriales bacterium]